jgi:hypothetical protein
MVLQTPGDPPQGMASGFLVFVGPLPPDGQPSFYLVSAQHSVREAEQRGMDLEGLVIRAYDPAKAVQDRVPVTLQRNLWEHSPNSDVSIIPFPVDALPEDHNLTAIPVTELASRKPGAILPQGAPLKVFGAWGRQPGRGLTIMRTTYLATFERPRSRIFIRPGVAHLVEVYLGDGTVSAGMSGGPVAYEGGGWGGSIIIGLIGGYCPFAEDDLALRPDEEDGAGRAAVLGQLRRDIAAVNSGLFYIVPIGDVEPLLEAQGFPAGVP